MISLQACLECLKHLLRLTANQQQAAQAGVVPVFLALIRPPPQHIVTMEQPVTMQRTFTFSPSSAASSNGREGIKQPFMVMLCLDLPDRQACFTPSRKCLLLQKASITACIVHSVHAATDQQMQNVTVRRIFTFSPPSAASTNGREGVKQPFMVMLCPQP